jgi:hypothetical protein
MFQLFSALRWYVVEQFFLMATRCSDGHRPLIFLITLLFSVLTVSSFFYISRIYVKILSKHRLQVEYKLPRFNLWRDERTYLAK